MRRSSPSRAERAGARMATVHGRTRAQFYEGRADWGAVRAVVERCRHPGRRQRRLRDRWRTRATMLALSGAAGVMIGRAAVGAPWLVGALSRALGEGGPAAGRPRLEERREAALEHLDWLAGKLGAARRDFAMRASISAAYADQARSCRRGASARAGDQRGRDRGRRRLRRSRLRRRAGSRQAA